MKRETRKMSSTWFNATTSECKGVNGIFAHPNGLRKICIGCWRHLKNLLPITRVCESERAGSIHKTDTPDQMLKTPVL